MCYYNGMKSCACYIYFFILIDRRVCSCIGISGTALKLFSPFFCSHLSWWCLIHVYRMCVRYCLCSKQLASPRHTSNAYKLLIPFVWYYSHVFSIPVNRIYLTGSFFLVRCCYVALSRKNDGCECIRYAQLNLQTYPYAISTAIFFPVFNIFFVLIYFFFCVSLFRSSIRLSDKMVSYFNWIHVWRTIHLSTHFFFRVEFR